MIISIFASSESLTKTQMKSYKVQHSVLTMSVCTLVMLILLGKKDKVTDLLDPKDIAEMALEHNLEKQSCRDRENHSLNLCLSP